MAILLNNDGFWHEQWRAAIEKYMPDREIVEYPDVPSQDAIDYALVWKHPHGDLVNYPNLKAVFSLGSGVDHLDGDQNLPDVPIFRLIDTAMADDMALYTLGWIIHFQRMFSTYRQQQAQSYWQRYPTPLAPNFKVCMLGLGAIGSHMALVLANNGFDVTGWSRSPKTIDGIKCISGHEALSDVLGTTDVLVNCLPLNTSTRYFLNENTLSQLKKGAHLINVSRGPVVEETALLKLLDSGHIAGAALDVFETEPLPETSPLWAHKSVHVTPHMSGATNPDTAVQIIAKDIELFERGGMPKYPYKRED
jgi:glyoxylate/hydroxypyruvate reductase A